MERFEEVFHGRLPEATDHRRPRKEGNVGEERRGDRAREVQEGEGLPQESKRDAAESGPRGGGRGGGGIPEERRGDEQRANFEGGRGSWERVEEEEEGGIGKGKVVPTKEDTAEDGVGTIRERREIDGYSEEVLVLRRGGGAAGLSHSKGAERDERDQVRSGNC